MSFMLRPTSQRHRYFLWPCILLPMHHRVVRQQGLSLSMFLLLAFCVCPYHSLCVCGASAACSDALQSGFIIFMSVCSLHLCIFFCVTVCMSLFVSDSLFLCSSMASLFLYSYHSPLLFHEAISKQGAFEQYK